MTIPAPLLEKIRLQLPYGAQKEIAVACKVSVQTVHKVLRGSLHQPEVLAAVVRYYVHFSRRQHQITADLRRVLQPAATYRQAA
jgi:hypothetical protein